MLQTWPRAAFNAGSQPAGRLSCAPALVPAALAPQQRRPWRRLPSAPGRLAGARLQGLGQDAVGTWLDLAGFVSASGSSGRTPYDELADKIGRDVYCDMMGWHLFLKDVRLGSNLSLAQGLAAQLGAQIDSQGFREADLQALLKKVPVKLGQGKVTVSLLDVLPSACVRDLEDICQDYARRR